MAQKSHFMIHIMWTVVVILLASSSALLVLARPLDSAVTLHHRLKVDDESSTDCWGSLLKLQACTGEVIQFFYNGETQLGTNCCRAIHIIEHNCWPAMLSSLGFTSQESAVLRGYCDAEEDQDDDTAGAAAPSPVN
ncbi:hypothetical protein Dimus_017513 [Dionaea muscipula]